MFRNKVKPARGSDMDIEPDYDSDSNKYSLRSSYRSDRYKRDSPAATRRGLDPDNSRSRKRGDYTDDESVPSLPAEDYGSESSDSVFEERRRPEPSRTKQGSKKYDPEDLQAYYGDRDSYSKSSLMPTVVIVGETSSNVFDNPSFHDDEPDIENKHGTERRGRREENEGTIGSAHRPVTLTEHPIEAAVITAFAHDDGSTSIRSRNSIRARNEPLEVAAAVGASTTAADLLAEVEEDVDPRGSFKRSPKWQDRHEESDEGTIQTGKRDSGYSKWKKERAKEWRRFKILTSETLDSLQIWQGSFKTIEGRFGSPVLAYFRFLKWLFLLNLLLALMVLGVIVLPQVSMNPSTFNESIPIPTNFTRAAVSCSDKYANSFNKSNNVITPILDFVQGTGWMERTPLFYGYYFNRTYKDIFSPSKTVNYNMSVGYLLTVFAYFLVSLFLMIHFTAKGMKNSITSGQDQLYLTCNKVFCGWDFSLSDLDAAKFKHVQLEREYMRDLALKRRQEELKNQSNLKRGLVITIRIIINIIVLAILVASGYLIYYMSTESIQWLKLAEINGNDFLKLLVEFSPSLAITALNFIVPLIFQKLVLAEDYSPTFEIKITIFRSVTLRLASVAVLLFGVGARILGCGNPEDHECRSCEPVSLCWETYIGQQFYKLVLLDFVTVVLMTFLVQFPRKLIVRSLEKSQSKLFKVASYQEFEIPKEVLDVVYSQTLCWIGSFVSPIVLCMTVVKFFLFFYIKKLSLLYNCQPATRLYRASSSQTFFMSILLLAFVLCAIPVAFAIGKIPPSYSCGPFRVYSREEYFMFNALTDLVETWPQWFQAALTFVTSWTFYVPLMVIVCLVTYYYVSLAAGKREYIKVLLQQLSVATKDKQFLVHEALARRQATKID